MGSDTPSEPTIPAKPLALGESWGENRRIGPYKLLQRIGEGGMGEVWMAEQSEPVKRRVALKVIKQGIGSKEVLARFEAERQTLSLMNHPNIARILDAGATPEGPRQSHQNFSQTLEFRGNLYSSQLFFFWPSKKSVKCPA